jgi:hypothetical protein
MNRSGLLKVLSGCLVAIVLILGGGFFVAQYLIGQFTAPPPKPLFANDKKPTVAPAAIAPKPKPSPPPPTPSVTPSPKPTETDYPAIVTLSGGLTIRANPNQQSERVGGVDFDEEVIVLEETPDQEWQRVRVKASNVEGWIKSRYTERITE